MAPSDAHPSFAEMVEEAILALKDRTGSSKLAIQKYIESKYKVDPTVMKRLNFYIKKMVENGQLVRIKASFKLNKASKPKAAAKPATKIPAKNVKTRTPTPYPGKTTKKPPTKSVKKPVPKKPAVKKPAATKPAPKKATPKKPEAAKKKLPPQKTETKKKATPKKPAAKPAPTKNTSSKPAAKVAKPAKPAAKSTKTKATTKAATKATTKKTATKAKAK